MSPAVVARVLKGLAQAKAQGLHQRAPSTVEASVSKLMDNATAKGTERVEKLRACFRTLDQDGSGYVDSSELRHYLSQTVSHTFAKVPGIHRSHWLRHTRSR